MEDLDKVSGPVREGSSRLTEFVRKGRVTCVSVQVYQCHGTRDGDMKNLG